MGQPSSPLCGSVWGEGRKRGLCHCLAFGGLPCAHSISSHFTHSPYVIGTLPAATMRSAYIVSPPGPIKWQKSGSCILSPHPHWYLQPEVRGFMFPLLEPWDVHSGLGLGIPGSQGISPYFYLPRVNVEPFILSLSPKLPLNATPPLCPISANLPHLPIWMNVAPLNLWLSDFHTA